MIIVSGQHVAPQGTTLAARPDLAGQVVADELAPFNDQSAGVHGTIQTRVVQVSAGTLDFYFGVREISGARVAGVRWVFPLAQLTTDVDYRIDGIGEVPPKLVVRESLPGGPVGTIDLHFDFSDGIEPGHSSRLVFVKTDATNYQRYPGLTIHGTPSFVWGAPIDAFGPVA